MSDIVALPRKKRVRRLKQEGSRHPQTFIETGSERPADHQATVQSGPLETKRRHCGVRATP
jgi:hypothetical protein